MCRRLGVGRENLHVALLVGADDRLVGAAEQQERDGEAERPPASAIDQTSEERSAGAGGVDRGRNGRPSRAGSAPGGVRYIDRIGRNQVAADEVAHTWPKTSAFPSMAHVPFHGSLLSLGS